MSFLDDDEPTPALEETPVEPEVVDETVADEVSESLSFLGEEESSSAHEEQESASDIEEADEEQIQFSVPGEQVADTTPDDTVAEADEEEIIDFMVPGGDAVSQQELSTMDSEESEEVIFEVVDDDVDLDPLPQIDESVVFSEVTEDGDEKLDAMQQAIYALQDDTSDTVIQSLLDVINAERKQTTVTSSDKIFLQLLSTTCQQIEKEGRDSSAAMVKLIATVYKEMKESQSAPLSEKTQEKIMECTSQVLIILQK